ncbi:MAG: hypothetical protein IKL85_04965 [Lentisphaeria bacterium]|jgi:hypothetical protein|nr:hypothetical protein [Lentisphaeria bacterium]
MNETTMKEKEPYEAPLVLEIKPVSVVRGNNENSAGDGEYDNLNEG